MFIKTGQDMQMDEDQKYQLYLDERKILIEAGRSSSQSFDKGILTVATGSFGFTIAFLKDIAPIPSPDTLCLLAWSWGLFSFSMAAILFSFFASKLACDKQIEVSHASLMKDQQLANPWAIVTSICNVSSIASLTLAVVFWCAFAYWNIPQP